MKKLKGIISFILSISVIFLMMPFNIYADTYVNTQYSSSESSWSTKLNVENYCDGSNTQASCKLTFTLNDNYYGWIMFDAYNGNTSLYSNQYVYVAGGIGEYNYLFYQSGVIPVNKVYISVTNLFLRGANIDLSEIVQLLTLINSSNQAIYSNSVTIRNNLISILEEEIESNGYLETITKLRAWNIPIESYSIIQNMMIWNANKIEDMYSNNYFNYPIFHYSQNDTIFKFQGQGTKDYFFIFYLDAYFNLSSYQNIFQITNATISEIQLINERISVGQNTNGFLYKIRILCNGAITDNLEITINSNRNMYLIPIYLGITSNKNFSTDFALNYGLSNNMLDNIQIIANGTSASQSAASGLEQSNNQMAQDMNGLATIESGYNQQFNNSLQTIDFTNPVSSNQGMLPAANFVISIFNGLISNNPFSVLIIVVCILLIGKKVIGK